MLPENARARINWELTAAENARVSGNEPKARVCARRAAGIAIQVLYETLGEPLADNNVITAFIKVQSDSRIDYGWRTFAGVLLQRVTEDHTLPVTADLLADTRRFIDEVATYLKGKQLER